MFSSEYAPAQSDLQGGMQVGDGAVAADEQPAPDQRADAAQGDAQLVHDGFVGRDRFRHAAIARPASSRLPRFFPLSFVEAARCVGAGDGRIVLRHMVPNVMAPYLRLATAFLGQHGPAALSLLGLGIAEPTPAWGLMLRGASVQCVECAPWPASAPGVALSLAVFAFNLPGDCLRDALDPRLRV